MIFKKLNYTEPAVLRGILTAVVALLAAVGISVSSDLTGQAEAAIATASVVLPLAQAIWTRMAVFSKSTVDKVKRTAPGTPQTPGVADHAIE